MTYKDRHGNLYYVDESHHVGEYVVYRHAAGIRRITRVTAPTLPPTCDRAAQELALSRYARVRGYQAVGGGGACA